MRNPTRNVREDLRAEWRHILFGALVVTMFLWPFESTVWEFVAIFVGVNVVLVIVVAVAGYPRRPTMSGKGRTRDG